MVDDRSSTVAARGGAARCSVRHRRPDPAGRQKRKVRRDLADVFCTPPKDVRGNRAKTGSWWIESRRRPGSKSSLRARRALAAESERPADAAGIALGPLERSNHDQGYRYRWVEVELAREDGTATLTITGPRDGAAPAHSPISRGGAQMVAAGDGTRTDDALLMLRVNIPRSGRGCSRPRGARRSAGLRRDDARPSRPLVVRETLGLLRRTLSVRRFSRSLLP